MSHPAIDTQITFIYTSDLARSTAFYEKTIGFQLWLDQGSCRIYHVSGSGLLGICQASDTSKGAASEGPQRNVILTLVTEDVDGWYAHLRNQGVAFEKPPQQNDTYRIYHCFLRDPDGYLIEIQRFLDVSHMPE
jgi:catechol 2,3-dioxygenase-like lactoylglutathione lyase family enzyme